jgi:glycosyltransferase involved in cell wall biosynthesis
MTAARPKVTVAIPLFRSERFLDTIIKNIDAIAEDNVEILISDRHCLDKAIDILARHFADDSRVRCIRAQDQLDWVGNINFLLGEARGEYWRFTPHDDIFPCGSLEKLVRALDEDPEAILAYGPTVVLDEHGETLLECNTPHPAEATEGWTLGLILKMHWNFYFMHAFKGLVRRDTVMANGLFIRNTMDNILPERCWLFGLALLGRFRFVPEASYRKIRRPSSVSSAWHLQGHHVLSVVRVMSSYLCDCVKYDAVCQYGTRDLWFNAGRRVRWMKFKAGPAPQYLPAPGGQSSVVGKFALPAGKERQAVGFSSEASAVER